MNRNEKSPSALDGLQLFVDAAYLSHDWNDESSEVEEVFGLRRDSRIEEKKGKFKLN